MKVQVLSFTAILRREYKKQTRFFFSLNTSFTQLPPSLCVSSHPSGSQMCHPPPPPLPKQYSNTTTDMAFVATIWLKRFLHTKAATPCPLSGATGGPSFVSWRTLFLRHCQLSVSQYNCHSTDVSLNQAKIVMFQ